jgi:SAM-dependent MidA family methyltransferase
MNPIEKKITERIIKEGPITFEAFMEMALYYPELGYYSSTRSPVGREGDFYTSSHLHPVFGAMLARQFIEMRDIMGSPSDFCVVEIGAGAGYLCKDILDYLEREDLPGDFKYIIVEQNPLMKLKQESLLRDFRGKVSWVKSLTELDSIRGCIVSNELLDAFPVHIVEMRGELNEVRVARDNNDFIFKYQPVRSNDVIDYFKRFVGKLSDGYRTEINLKVKNWIGEISSILSSGFVLTVDYGYTSSEYYTEERSGGTLLCFHRHQVIKDPLLNIGEQDITAHVNFSSLSTWGEESGFKTLGYCPQGSYLVASGIDEMIQELYQNSSDYSFEVSRIKNLILPEGMGESHKVLIQYKGEGVPELRGFSLRNQVEKLIF